MGTPESRLHRSRQRGQGNFELNSHARLACYTMNKTGVASGNFYKKILFPM